MYITSTNMYSMVLIFSLSAVKDCHAVMHIASPFPVENPKDENELIIPAEEGTKHVLRACASTPSVKCVVLTSSLAAVWGEYTCTCIHVCISNYKDELGLLHVYFFATTN